MKPLRNSSRFCRRMNMRPTFASAISRVIVTDHEVSAPRPDPTLACLGLLQPLECLGMPWLGTCRLLAMLLACLFGTRCVGRRRRVPGFVTTTDRRSFTAVGTGAVAADLREDGGCVSSVVKRVAGFGLHAFFLIG